MKLPHYIQVGAVALTLSGCPKEKEKTDFEKQKEGNAAIIQTLLEKYPQ